MTAFAFLYPMMFLLVSSYLGEFVENRAIRRQGLNPSTQKPNSRRRLSATTPEWQVLTHSEHFVKSLDKTNDHLSGLEAGLKRDINTLFEMRCNAWVADAIVPITENETNKRNSKYGALDMKVNHALKSLEASGASQQERIDLLTRGIAQLKKDIRRKIRSMVDGNKWIKKARKVNTKAEQKSGSSNPLTLHDSVGVQTNQAQPLILHSLAIKAPTETSENTNCQSSEASGIIENSGNTQRPTVSTSSPRASTPSPTPQQPQALRLYVKASTEKSRDTNCQSSEVSGITWSSENTLRRRKKSRSPTPSPPPQLRQRLSAGTLAVTGPTKKSNPVRFNSANEGKHPTGQSCIGAAATGLYGGEKFEQNKGPQSSWVQSNIERFKNWISASKPEQGNGPQSNTGGLSGKNTKNSRSKGGRTTRNNENESKPTNRGCNTEYNPHNQNRRRGPIKKQFWREDLGLVWDVLSLP